MVRKRKRVRSNGTTIKFYNIKDQTTETVDLIDIVEEDIQSTLEKIKNNFGVTLNIERITDGESFVRSYFENEGFDVIRCDPTNWSPNWEPTTELKKVIRILEKKYDFEEDDIITAGVPDFLIYDLDNEIIFFVEVKMISDGLSMNQIRWMTMNKVPTKIAYIEKND